MIMIYSIRYISHESLFHLLTLTHLHITILYLAIWVTTSFHVYLGNSHMHHFNQSINANSQTTSLNYTIYTFLPVDTSAHLQNTRPCSCLNSHSHPCKSCPSSTSLETEGVLRCCEIR